MPKRAARTEVLTSATSSASGSSRQPPLGRSAAMMTSKSGARAQTLASQVGTHMHDPCSVGFAKVVTKAFPRATLTTDRYRTFRSAGLASAMPRSLHDVRLGLADPCTCRGPYDSTHAVVQDSPACSPGVEGMSESFRLWHPLVCRKEASLTHTPLNLWRMPYRMQDIVRDECIFWCGGRTSSACPSGWLSAF